MYVLFCRNIVASCSLLEASMSKYETSSVSLLADSAVDESCQRIIDSISTEIRSGKLSPGSRLQSENKLTEVFNVSVHSVRKALARLKDEGLLYSVPKFGVFVEDAKKLETLSLNDDFDQPMASTLETTVKLNFATRSRLPRQRALWEKISASFSKNNFFTEIEFCYQQSQQRTYPQSDIYEYAAASHRYFSNRKLLDIRRYFPDSVLFPELMGDHTGVPLYYTGPVLLYNLDLLEKLGCSAPCYKNYCEEVEYFEEVTQKSLAAGLKVPGSAQNMVFRLGNWLDEIFYDIKEEKLAEKEFIAKYENLFHELAAYWGKYKISFPKRAVENFNAFVRGESVFVFALSADLAALRSQPCSFRYGGALMYAIDDTLTRIPVVLAVDAQSPHPVESLRLIRHCQSPEYQRDFAEMGFFPLEAKNLRHLPYTNLPDSPVFARPVCFQTPEQQYVVMNVLNVELWNIVLFDKPVKEAISEILMFARAYLNLKLDQSLIEEQQKWTDVYDT